VTPGDLRSHPLLAEFTDVELGRLASRLEEVDVEPGTELTRTGERAMLFFLIVEGEAVVSREGRRLFSLGAGDFFGEIGLLDDDVRTADVVAVTPMRVAAMLPGDFRGMLEELPDLGAVVRATAEMRRGRPAQP
jgi:CRP-like cAMP-binding protein